MNNATIIIPARKGSKGFPKKNRLLFDFTAKEIPAHLSDRVVVTSDDEEILGRAETYNFRIIERSEELSQDDTSLWFVIKDVVDQLNITPDHDLITLYPTYPQRTWVQVEDIYKFYKKENARSLLCRKDLHNHPYMCFYKEGFKGKKIVKHNLCRRQEYPECFEASHYVVITKANVLDSLDKNLYFEDTHFYHIENSILDIDYLEDFERFKKSKAAPSPRYFFWGG